MSDSQEVSNELLAASVAGDDETITRLLQQGASVLSEDENGDTGLHVSCEKGHEKIVRIFLDHESAHKLTLNNELLAASVAGDGEAVTRLLEKGASVLYEDVFGDKGLHLSAKHGHDDIVKLFLDHETDVNILGASDMTPLMNAAQQGHLVTTRPLIDSGADLELRCSDGKTALAWTDQPDVVSELLKRGAREDVTNNDNETALQEAEK